jgi:hypothetical protein
LLSTAGIVYTEAGYSILINVSAAGASAIEKKRLDLTAEDFSRLNAPLRFTIAHEMAHVFFFDLLDDEASKQLLRKHWRAVENTCNQIARVLLAPKSVLLRELDGGLYSVIHLRRVIRRFGISPEVFIRRLNMDDMKSIVLEQEGLIAYIRRTERGLRIVASHALGDLASTRWPKARHAKGVPISRLFLCARHEIESMVASGRTGVVETEVIWRPDEFIPCRVEVHAYHSKSLNSIVTVRFLGHLQKRSTPARTRS